jgi:major membrane immunogen (membrane-anchored lipoprotein)
MKLIENIDSTAINAVRAGDDSIVTITFNNGKSYDYRDTTGNFVNSVENAMENHQSVGRLFNRALKEDQTLQIVTV